MIPLSNNTVACRTDRMSSNILCQLVSCVKNNGFYPCRLMSQQILHWLIFWFMFVSYIMAHFMRNFCFVGLLPASRSTGEDIFNLINNFMKDNGIEWVCCVGINTDGSMSMTGKQRTCSLYQDNCSFSFLGSLLHSQSGSCLKKYAS